MATPFLAEIRPMAFNFAPKGWAFCNGQLMSIAQNQALFSLLGTTFGGNGTITFGLPDLQGRTPIHSGNGFVRGQRGGETSHTLSLSEMPTHTHVPQAQTAAANAGGPAGNTWSATGAYGGSPDVVMTPASISNVGGNQPHENMSPYLVVNFCIALIGVYPSQN